MTRLLKSSKLKYYYSNVLIISYLFLIEDCCKDWIRAERLREKTKNRNEEAAKELEKMAKT